MNRPENEVIRMPKKSTMIPGEMQTVDAAPKRNGATGDAEASSPSLEKEEKDETGDGSSSGVSKDLQEMLESLSQRLCGYQQDKIDHKDDARKRLQSEREQLLRDIYEVIHGRIDFAGLTKALKKLTLNLQPNMALCEISETFSKPFDVRGNVPLTLECHSPSKREGEGDRATSRKREESKTIPHRSRRERKVLTPNSFKILKERSC